MPSDPWGTIAIIMALSVCMIIYLGIVQPWVNPLMNKVDLADECFLLAICYCMLHLTEYDFALDNRYMWGIVLICVAVLHMLFHIVLLLFTTFSVIFLEIKKRCSSKEGNIVTRDNTKISAVEHDKGINSRKMLREVAKRMSSKLLVAI